MNNLSSDQKGIVMYEPWSSTIMDHVLDDFSKGRLPVLGIELSARCDHNLCLYCDSLVGKPNRSELSLSELKKVVGSGKKIGVEYLYICGLGEPSDDAKFYELIEYLNEMDITTSVFTNGIGYNKENVQMLLSNNVNLIIKLDSLDETIFDQLLGKEGAAKCIYRTLNLLLREGYSKKRENCLTNLAASIVPTRKNIKSIPEVVEYCNDNNIFASIGELEFSGKAKAIFHDLVPSDKQLTELKKKVDKILGYNYEKPVCPSTIVSLHINSVGEYVVDRNTALSCPWFLLKEPDCLKIGSVRKDRIEDVFERMLYLRERKIDSVRGILLNDSERIFGGCGGSIRKLLRLYVNRKYN